MLSATNEGLWDWDMKAGKVYRSPRLQEILGLDASVREASPAEWIALIHPADSDQYRSRFRTYLKGESDHHECRYRLKDASGNFRWVLEYGKGLRNHAGRFYRIAGSLRDITEQVEAEAQLRRSEQRFRNIVETASDVIWETDAEHRFTYVSGIQHDRLGIPNQDILGKTPWEFAGIDLSTDKNWSERRAAMEFHLPFRDFRYVITTRQGKERFHRVAGVPVFDEDGLFAGYRGTTMIDTETQLALRRARDAEALLHDAIDSISEGFVIFDKDDRFVMCNQTYRDRHPVSAAYMKPGTKYEAILRHGVAKSQYVEAIGREEAWIAERLRRRREGAGSVQHQLKDGRHILYTDRRMPNGGLAGLRMDITALKQAETALIKNQHLLQTTFEAIDEGVVVIDDGLRIAALNHTLFDFLGTAPGTVNIGDSVEALVRACYSALDNPKPTLDRFIEQEIASIRRFQPCRIEHILRGGRVLEVHDNPLPEGGVVRTCRDITKQKTIESDLRTAAFHARKASEAKSAFVASMSHELRTPLNAIMGFSEVMQNGVFGPLGDSRYHEYVRDIHQSGGHLLAIISDILDFSKIESGNTYLSEERIELSALIRETVAILRLAAEKGKITLALDIPGSRYVTADGTKFKQILMNLLSNAIKFTPAGGRVMLHCAVDANSGVTLKVSDTGIGMAPEEIPIALEPFRQLDGHLSRRHPGTGLGLPLTKRLVELHGGSLTIDSEYGRGTTVTVLLPAKPCTCALP